MVAISSPLTVSVLTVTTLCGGLGLERFCKDGEVGLDDDEDDWGGPLFDSVPSPVISIWYGV